jgi:hypothetical protein
MSHQKFKSLKGIHFWWDFYLCLSAGWMILLCFKIINSIALQTDCTFHLYLPFVAIIVVKSNFRTHI